MLPTAATVTKLQPDLLEELIGVLLSSSPRMAPSPPSSCRVDISVSASSSAMTPSTTYSSRVDISGSAFFLDEEPKGGGADADGEVVRFNVVRDNVGLDVGGGANVGGPLVGLFDREGVDVGCSLGVEYVGGGCEE
jgi:hypothetical protein